MAAFGRKKPIWIGLAITGLASALMLLFEETNLLALFVLLSVVKVANTISYMVCTRI